jgi:tetratricopeptide (TPR) repeat protein
MPVLEALTRLAQGTGGERVVELFDRFAPTWLAQMPALLTAEQRVRLQGQSQGVTQQRMLREVTLALEALAAEAPLVLVFEDLHWSDFSTLELISAIARRNESAQLTIVGTYRPIGMLAHDHPLRAMVQELELHHQCEELRLKLLSEEDVASYLEKRFFSAVAQNHESFAAVIYERTDGNPLFMINVVEYLVGVGLLAGSHEGNSARPAESVLLPHHIEVPRSIRQMIERNFERLNPEERVILEAASVAGAEFSAAAVAAALERPMAEVEACCAGLARHEQFVTEKGPIIWPDGTISSGFDFHHSLYQEVLYGLLPLGRRVQLHRLIAAREEAGHGDGTGEIAAELAHHYEQANDKDRAIYFFRVAGERAVARGASVEAEVHYRRALELLGELSPSIERDRQELTLHMALGAVLWGSKSWAHPEADRTYKRALVLAEELREPHQIVRILTGLIVSALGNGKFKLAHELSERMLVVAENSRDPTSLCAAHGLLGESLVMQAQYLNARRHLEQGLMYYAESNQDEVFLVGIDAGANAAIVELMLGFPDRARKLMKEVLSRPHGRHGPSAVGLAHFWGAEFCMLNRDPKGALEHARALRGLSVQQPVWEGFAELYTGEALTAQGKWAEAALHLYRALALYERIGNIWLLSFAKLSESISLAGQGRIDDAIAVVSEAIGVAEQFDHFRFYCNLQRANLFALGNTESAAVDAAYAEIIETARSQSAKYNELQAVTQYARWLKSQARIVEARSILADVCSWFTEGLDTIDLKEAKTLLDELTM